MHEEASVWPEPLLAAVYLGVAAVFALATFVEGFASRGGGHAWRVLGLALCAIWPLVLVAVLVAVCQPFWNRRSRTSDGKAELKAPH